MFKLKLLQKKVHTFLHQLQFLLKKKKKKVKKKQKKVLNQNKKKSKKKLLKHLKNKIKHSTLGMRMSLYQSKNSNNNK